MRRVAFFVISALCLCPLIAPAVHVAFVPPAALIAGILFALLLGNPYPEQSKKTSKYLLQTAVVLLGFSMDLQKILDAGSKGLVFALGSIIAVFVLGYGLQKLLNVRPLTSLLVSTGTAICGGSAIAAMSAVTDAPQEDVSVAVGTVFLLNAVALVIFPPLGHGLGLTPEQFGVWAGIAIHDVSSVVGAATAFGNDSLETATAVKLSRVLYLVPITLMTAFWLARPVSALHRDPSSLTAEERGAYEKRGTPRKRAVAIPWFILFFLIASLLRTYVPEIQPLGPTIKLLAVSGFSISLFLIGAGITMTTLRAVGLRPMFQGVLLWAFISVVALLAARQT